VCVCVCVCVCFVSRSQVARDLTPDLRARYVVIIVSFRDRLTVVDLCSEPVTDTPYNRFGCTVYSQRNSFSRFFVLQYLRRLHCVYNVAPQACMSVVWPLTSFDPKVLFRPDLIQDVIDFSGFS